MQQCKKLRHGNIELQENQENVTFYSSDFNLDLYKSQTNEAIENNWKRHWFLYLPLQFLFSWPFWKINSLPTRAANLKAVKGGESALAMAKRRYSTVLLIVVLLWYSLYRVLGYGQNKTGQVWLSIYIFMFIPSDSACKQYIDRPRKPHTLGYLWLEATTFLA